MPEKTITTKTYTCDACGVEATTERDHAAEPATHPFSSMEPSRLAGWVRFAVDVKGAGAAAGIACGPECAAKAFSSMAKQAATERAEVEA